MEEFRLIRTIEASGAVQMAIDEAILTARIRNLVPNTLRFFTWKPPCVTIGFFQSLEQEVDVKKARELGVDIVRRYTGGGAVFHDKELTYSIVLSEKEASADIIESYKKICGGIVSGLETLGIKAEFKPINDIVVNGKKISGSAQTRKGGIILQHGTILMDTDVKKMFSLLKVPDEKFRDKMIKAAQERVTSLKTEAGREINRKELENAIVSGFGNVFGARFSEGRLTKEETKLAERLQKGKYSTKDWCCWR
ncbi:MAG: lipoate--protein ligase family protein [Candidatus Aenigmatarchaeota archaeon]